MRLRPLRKYDIIKFSDGKYAVCADAGSGFLWLEFYNTTGETTRILGGTGFRKYCLLSSKEEAIALRDKIKKEHKKKEYEENKYNRFEVVK
jgi:hypothetical protein